MNQPLVAEENLFFSNACYYPVTVKGTGERYCVPLFRGDRRENRRHWDCRYRRADRRRASRKRARGGHGDQNAGAGRSHPSRLQLGRLVFRHQRRPWGRSNDPMTIANANPIFTVGFDATAAQGLHTSGFTGGIQGGYNWQSGTLLAGFEVDFEYFRSAGSQNIVFPTPNGPGFTSTLNKSVSTDWLLTARPRVGVVSNNWLFYATGGLAVTQLKASWVYSDTAMEASNASVSSTQLGWTVGGGIETALPGNWLLGAEYLYVSQRFDDRPIHAWRGSPWQLYSYQ
jgi:opacity protein-like surface antigen